MKGFVYYVIVIHGEDEIAELRINANNERELWQTYYSKYADKYPNDSVAIICGCD